MERIEDLFGRLREKAATKRLTRSEGQGAHPRLLPDRHPIRDFFVADILDWALKVDRHSMEHPMFALSKNPDRKERHYEHNGNHISITPSIKGLATIWDKDLIIYAISQLMEGINQNRPTSRVIQLIAHALLVATNRHTGGGDYEQLEQAFERLAGTRIRTNITTNGEQIRHGFGLIDEWKIIDKSPSGRMVRVEITLSQWLYNAVLAHEVLTLNRDYFRLKGALERRLYELARKHCGQQTKWLVNLELLRKKTGSTASTKEFRRNLKALATANLLPDYSLRYDTQTDSVLFYTKDSKQLAGRIAADLN
jgi:plasmid replication initiation protein